MTENLTDRRFVLVTGAAGRIGAAFVEDAGDRYRFRVTDREAPPLPSGDGHETLALDVADLDACRAACRGVDTVLHLAADPSPEADFYGSLLDNNVKGTYNVFRAAADAGCRRVVFASSVHAVVGYPEDVQPRTDSPVRPLNMYGVSKCFGEAVAACFATSGPSAIAIRIGAYDAPWIHERPTAGAMSMYVSRRDLNQLMARCIDAADVSFAIVHGLSNNRFKRMDLASTRDLLGYAPEDDAFRLFGVDLPE
ncbi:MAG: NAD(P)-dependent oxidoreductase [Chloroflexota bacterium]|nr:NAD(P)-dependent oxidoreductase [Chloroflexota bacterium]